MFDEIASELKTAREKNSLTLAQLANKTKIDIKFLEAMEHGDFSFLPELYVKAFLKNYAKMIGLNETKIIKKYEAAKQGLPFVEQEPAAVESKTHSPEIIKEEKPIVQRNKSETFKKDPLFTFDAVTGASASQETSVAAKQRNLIIGISSLAIILLFGVLYLFFFKSGSNEIVVEKPIEEVIQQNQRYLENEANVTSDDFGNSDSLQLVIVTTDTSWVKMFVDDNTPDEFILLPKSQKIVKAKNNYLITFGNSGAIKLQLNNKPLAFSGKNRAPANVKIDRSGLKILESSQR